MPGLVPGIHALYTVRKQGVDGRDKPGHDEERKCLKCLKKKSQANASPR
jgi:hypothetical protein